MTRSLYIILLLFISNNYINGQQIKSFPENTEDFYKAFNNYLGNYKNETLKASYKIFKSNWDEDLYSNQMKNNFVIAFNLMLKRKMQPYPYMHYYMNTVNVFMVSGQDRGKIFDWQKITIQILKTSKRGKHNEFKFFVNNTATLFEDYTLYKDAAR